MGGQVLPCASLSPEAPLGPQLLMKLWIWAHSGVVGAHEVRLQGGEKELPHELGADDRWLQFGCMPSCLGHNQVQVNLQNEVMGFAAGEGASLPPAPPLPSAEGPPQPLPMLL